MEEITTLLKEMEAKLKEIEARTGELPEDLAERLVAVRDGLYAQKLIIARTTLKVCAALGLHTKSLEDVPGGYYFKIKEDGSGFWWVYKGKGRDPAKILLEEEDFYSPEGMISYWTYDVRELLGELSDYVKRLKEQTEAVEKQQDQLASLLD